MLDMNKVSELAKRLTALELRFKAAHSEFTAASMMGDAKEMSRLRDNMHTYLDAQLDAIHELNMMGTPAGK